MRYALVALIPLLGGCTVGVGAVPVPLPPAPPPPVHAEVPAVETVREPVVPEPVAVAPADEGLPMARRLEMRATAYCLRGNMRTGVRVREGMAAGDPAVLPLGSVVRVSHPDGRVVGIFVIMDTGGAVRGNRLDLWMDSCADARQWGVRTVVAEVVRLGRG